MRRKIRRLGWHQLFLNLKSKFNTPRPVIILGKYFVKRPFSVGVMIISIILSALGGISITHLYNYDNPPTKISLFQYTDDCIRISDGWITVDYDDKGKQTLVLTLNVFCENGNLQGKTVTFQVSSNIKTDNSYKFQDGSINRYQYEQFYHYTFTQPQDKGTIQESFEGNLFGANKSQLNLDLNIDSSYIPKPIPFKIMVVGLSNMDITDVLPEPDERLPYAIIYNNQVLNDDLFGIDLKISGIDRVGINQNQFYNLLIGLGLGLVFSVITTIFYDIISFIDTSLEESHDKQIRVKRITKMNSPLRIRRQKIRLLKKNAKRKRK